MSRYFNNFMDDYSEELEHSWGTSPKAKAREKEYNHWYYQKHKAEIEAVRKQRRAATNSYKQAEKSHNDAHRYEALSNKIYDRYLGYHVGPTFKGSNGHYYSKLTPEYSGNLKESAIDRLDKYQKKYIKMFRDSNAKAREYRSQGARQKASAKAEANRILRGIKNPTAKDLVEFYLDTTVAKATKSASKAANKAKKYATKAMSTADKYATKAMSTAEKSARKAKKYATKTIKSVVR